MELKKFTKSELMDFLLNGILLPDTALINKNTISFYFEELENFINLADNDFVARSSDNLEITVSFGYNNTDYVVMKKIEDYVLFLIPPQIADDIVNIGEREAQDIVGLVYGLIVYNAKWEEVSALANTILKEDEEPIILPIAEPMKANSFELVKLKKYLKRISKYA
tara:strand:- start:212 stop:709 length:498 start_codon:yes stop_codon:yes gene_type:complete